MDECSEQGCSKSVHSKGLCQAHYRQQRRRELDPAVGTRKPGPPAVPGAQAHQRLSDEEKQRRREMRREAQTHCVQGHKLTPVNTYRTKRGQKVCRVCQRTAQQRFRGRLETPDVPIGPKNRDKTHCPAGHGYTPENTYSTRNQRHCRKCVRDQRIRRVYGLEPEEYDGMLTRQKGGCGICGRVLEEGKNLHVDHDHTTTAVRGLLCTPCNNGLGCFGDDIEVLQAAVRYLRRVSRSKQGSKHHG